MDRSSIFETAKKHFLKSGQHNPILFLETEDMFYRVPIEDFSRWNQDTFAREKLLFMMGRTLARKEAIHPNTVRTIRLVQEFWYIYRRSDEPVPHDPSNEADRRESLGMLELVLSEDTKQITQAFYQCEIIRNGSIVDLAPYEEGERVSSYLLVCFLAGIATEQWDDKEFQQVIDRYLEVGEI